ncbi:MAG: amidase [Alphaproteobacteria bacterium]|nr:amidase [Alphaproteobacteria bacterium]
MPELADLSVAELLAGYARRSFSPVEVAKACFERISRHDGVFNAFCLVDEARALGEARASEARWARGTPSGTLDGVPATIKDLLLTKGWPTLRGSRLIERDQPWVEDAPTVARLREQNAVLLGKTTTPEFGWKGIGDSLLTGITRNPWDPTKTAGGSSAGAAVAAALGMGALHVGTDGGGSIRMPAGFCGIFGLKPTYGRVAAYPASPAGLLAHIGPMARSVDDAARMMEAIARPDPRDVFSLPADNGSWLLDLEKGVSGLRIGFSPRLGTAQVDPEIAAAAASAAKLFADLGAIVEPAEPELGDLREAFYRLWTASLARPLLGFARERWHECDPGLVATTEAGERWSAQEYLSADALRMRACEALARFHRRYDLLLTPQLPLTAFTAGHDVASPDQTYWIDWTPFTYPFNMTRNPAASVPAGLHSNGLPMAIQLVGRYYEDRVVMRAARAVERAQPWAMPKPP